MHDQWTHIGRLWTNGEPFLAVDAALRDAWQGFSNNEFGQITELGPHDASISAGAGRALIVGADAVVRDDSLIEVFEAASGRAALVQACGPDYPDKLKVRWYTELDEDNCFARWLLTQVQAND